MRILGSVLPDSVNEPIIYAAVVLVLTLVSVSAVLIPAIRASKIEPMVALRYE